MALDREDTLKKAEKFLRQGRLDAAIAEYLRVVEDQPRDWTTANTLGDMYVRAGQPQKAVAQYTRIADHFMREGFYPKAAALFKKVLKIAPDDESAQVKLAELSTKQGLLADAKSYWNAIAARRRARGDHKGAAEIVIRLGEIDPADFEARFAAARTLAEIGDARQAAAKFRDLNKDLTEKDRGGEALAALRQAVTLDPSDKDARVTLARMLIAGGDHQAARQFLDRESAGNDPVLLMALLDMELGSGNLEQTRELLPYILSAHRTLQDGIVELAWTLCAKNPDAAYACIEAVVESSIKAKEYGDAAAMLQEFVTRVPGQIPALLKLVEICVDGGLEATMQDAQAQLADAYLAAGHATEARVIAEDLVAREPWERTHIERFRRALILLRVSDPDTVIAERLSGQSPFTAHDPFADTGAMPILFGGEPPPAPAALPDVRAAEPASPGQSTASKDGARPGGAEIDLTTALGGLHSAAPSTGPPQPTENLEEVFKDLREEARHSGPDQGAQHLTLARTYLQMGMEDEAIESLATASRWPRHRFESASQLGQLYQKRGDVEKAIEWFERASEAPAPTLEDGHAVLYELGSLLQTVGETARAFAVFLELQADAGEYRDVAARVDHLARVQAGG